MRWVIGTAFGAAAGPILVGEKEPEIWVPPTRGQVISNEALAAGAGGAKTPANIYNTFDSRQLTDAFMKRRRARSRSSGSSRRIAGSCGR